MLLTLCTIPFDQSANRVARIGANCVTHVRAYRGKSKVPSSYFSPGRNGSSLRMKFMTGDPARELGTWTSPLVEYTIGALVILLLEANMGRSRRGYSVLGIIQNAMEYSHQCSPCFQRQPWDFSHCRTRRLWAPIRAPNNAYPYVRVWYLMTKVFHQLSEWMHQPR